jgi:hypothetical protein
VPAVITDMSVQEARLYATDHALRTSAQSATRSIVQLIVAARDNEEHGGVWSVDRVTEQIGIKKSTYTHAWSSVNYACLELKKIYPVETEGLGTTELIAMAVRSDFMPAFTSLYKGDISVNKFYRENYMVSDISLERRRQQQEAKAKSDRERAIATDGPESTPVADGTSGAKIIPLVIAASTPASLNQLIAEGFVSFAQALSLRRREPGASANEAEEEVARLISDFLDKHQELEGELLRFSNLILKRLNSRNQMSPIVTQGSSKKTKKVPTPKQKPELPLIDSIQMAV